MSTRGPRLRRTDFNRRTEEDICNDYRAIRHRERIEIPVPDIEKTEYARGTPGHSGQDKPDALPYLTLACSTA
jgi:hypothetical protein